MLMNNINSTFSTYFWGIYSFTPQIIKYTTIYFCLYFLILDRSHWSCKYLFVYIVPPEMIKRPNNISCLIDLAYGESKILQLSYVLTYYSTRNLWKNIVIVKNS